MTVRECEAKSTSGPNGFGLDQVQKILGDLFSKLMQGSKNGSASPSPSSGQGQSCTTYTPTADQTLAASNPCFYYVPSVSSSLLNGVDPSITGQTNVSQSLLEALGGTGDTNTETNTNTNATDIGSVLSSVTGSANTNTTATTSSQPQTILSTTQQSQSLLTPGISGDIRVLSSGGTVVAGNVDAGGNSAVAGFFGSDTFGGQPQGVVAQLCRSRPWASNFLTYVLPSTFFDSLCVLRGYTVGTPAPVQSTTVTVVQSTPKQIEQVSATEPPATAVEPKVDIWASPSIVPLGSRTSVFWNTQGVKSCTVTSPDGNFNQTSLSGGASTAPITASTVFTISCLTTDDEPITDNATVRIAI